jgi:four helix bundle protein
VTYRRFEELPVWNDAIELARQVFELAAAGRLKRYSGLRDQLERAVVSISNNIAEGFERGTNEELLTFLYYARGSAGEVRSMLHLLERVEPGDPTSSGVAGCLQSAESISRQLGRWIESIKDSGYRGTRSRTTAVRQAEANGRRRDAFVAQLRRIQDSARGNDPADASE